MSKQAENKTLMTIKNLSAGFFTTTVLSNINMDITEHQVVAIIGPSGCGKSTFLRCLNRLHEEVRGAYVNGQVLLNHKNIYNKDMDPVKVRRLVGMVFQKPNPFPGFSIFDNVAIGCKLMGIRGQLLQERVEHSLKQAVLWDEVKDILKRPGSSLSGGQQQRLCIARALAIDPSVILMDEPTSALDPVSTSRIENLIRTLKHQVTVVIVTHNMQQASRISNTTAFFLSGKLIEFEKTSTMFTNPKNSKTEAYITGRFG